MPEVHFRVRWPDQSVTRAYSPSSTIKTALRPGHPYPVSEFVTLARAALEHASVRVAQIYGYGCGHASAQIREFETIARRFDGANQTVTIEAFED